MKGAINFAHVLSHFYGSPWAIHPPKLAELHRVLWSRIESGRGITRAEFVQREQSENDNGEFLSSSSSRGPLAEEGGAVQTTRTDAGYTIIGAVGLIRISGVISARPSIMDEFSGGTSHEAIGKATDAAAADGRVEHIVYDINSPGGQVFGMPENGAKVLAARKLKPTVAVANHFAASAGYWYMSQAAEAVVAPSGTVGCIGVLLQNIDATEALKMAGIKDELITSSKAPFKSEGYPQVPFTEAARADLQRTADIYEAMFIEAVAKGRGVRAAKVEKDFGQGRMLLAEEALAAKMVDRVATLSEVIDNINKAKTKKAQRNIAAQMVALKLPTQ